MLSSHEKVFENHGPPLSGEMKVDSLEAVDFAR